MVQTGAQVESAQNLLSLSDLDISGDEPRVCHTRLAVVLGYVSPYDLTALIERNADELTRYGEIFRTVRKNTDPKRRGRPGTNYWLTEGQALLATVRSDAPNAPDAREQIIRVFMAWRRGAVAAPATDLGGLHARVAHLEQRMIAAPPPALTDRLRPGMGVLLTEDGAVVFDTRDTVVKGGDPVLAIVPEKTGQTPRLEVFQAAHYDALVRVHGDRTVMIADPPRHVAAMGETIQKYRYCTVVGRVVDVQPAPTQTRRPQSNAIRSPMRKDGRGRRLPEAVVAKARDLLAQGLSDGEVAEQVSISRASVYNIRTNKWPKRRSRGRETRA